MILVRFGSGCPSFIQVMTCRPESSPSSVSTIHSIRACLPISTTCSLGIISKIGKMGNIGYILMNVDRISPIYCFSSVLHISIDDKRLFFAFLSILQSVFMFVLKEMHLWFLYLSPLKDLILLVEILHAWPSPWGQSNKWNCQVAFFNKHMSPCKYLRTV